MLAEEAVGLEDWLSPTVRHGYERHAVLSVAPEAFFRRLFSLSSDKISTWTSAEDFMESGIMDLLPRLPVLGIVAHVSL